MFQASTDQEYYLQDRVGLLRLFVTLIPWLACICENKRNLICTEIEVRTGQSCSELPVERLALDDLGTLFNN